MNYICVFSKAPIPGQVKTRLAKEIGANAAADLAKAMLMDNCTMLSQIANVEKQVWYTPENSIDDFAGMIPNSFTLHPQRGKDLGERMSHTFRNLLHDKTDKAIILGSDCITHTKNLMMKALRSLDSCPLVLQPAADGGYVLIGQSSWNPKVFVDIHWGSTLVLKQSLERMTHFGLDFKLLPTTFDIDRLDDLSKIIKFLEESQRPHTFKWLKENGFFS